MNLIAPYNEQKILLHTCCAPCAGSLIEALQSAGLDITLYYYNPNIFPQEEYELRKKETEVYAKKMRIPCVTPAYNYAEWEQYTQGYENEPERGRRCTLCFHMRLGQLAKYAYENGFKVITSSLGISRWKNFDHITECGKEAAKLYPDIIYWAHNWRKKGGSERMYAIAKENHFYKQEYCGCRFSLEQTIAWRTKNRKETFPSVNDAKDKKTHEDNVKRYA
jgi:hypothetical protein